MTRLTTMFSAFVREEDGVALTEYLILLGLLVGGVIASVSLAGNNLETAWNNWGAFFLTVDP
jgi:pilus assembly protein Flp/PilA